MDIDRPEGRDRGFAGAPPGQGSGPGSPFGFEADGPWGPGGLEHTVSPDDEPGLRGLLLSVGSVGRPAAEAIAAYASRLSQFADEGGPRNATAVGEALGWKEGAVNGKLDPKRLKWNAKVVRHQLGVAALGDRFDAVVIGGHYTEYDRPGAYVVTAHAFSKRGRMLVGASRAILDTEDEADQIAQAYSEVAQEVMSLLIRLKLRQSTPVLVESTVVGEAVIRDLATLPGDYLIELPKSWAEGGLTPADDVDREDLSFGGGGPLRGLFPQTDERPVQARPVVLGAWSHRLEAWAVIARDDADERVFLGRIQDGSKFATFRAGPALEDSALHWSRQNLAAGAARNYGLDRYRAPKPHAFQRHCTALSLRDAYFLKSSGGSGTDRHRT